MDQLYLFSASSTNNESNKHLWVTGASLFIPQINQLLEHTTHKFKILSINDFHNENEKLVETIFNTNKSDKSTSHNYHILYSFIFNKLNADINILEIGLGTNNPQLISTMGVNGRPGASLYAFREYLPSAHIYGCDIDKNILFESDSIKTCYVDQLNLKTFENVSNNFGDIKYDLIVDDGLHSIGANFNTLLFALKNVNVNGWIVIEDIQIPDNWKAIDFILQSTHIYETYMIKALYGHLYVIHNVMHKCYT